MKTLFKDGGVDVYLATELKVIFYLMFPSNENKLITITLMSFNYYIFSLEEIKLATNFDQLL